MLRGTVAISLDKSGSPAPALPFDPSAQRGGPLTLVVDGGLTAGRTWSQMLHRIDQLKERFQSAVCQATAPMACASPGHASMLASLR